jgi:type VI secretion system secreted protein Hcp
MATIDCYLKIDGVDGESTHKGGEGQIEVDGWTWDVTNLSSASVGGGSGVGKATLGEFNFSHNYDKASPVLAKCCASGKHIATAKLTVAKAGEGQKEFLTVTLKQVMAVSVSISGSTGGEIRENVSLSYADIEFQYKAQDDKGATAGAIVFGHNRKTTESR